MKSPLLLLPALVLAFSAGALQARPFGPHVVLDTGLDARQRATLEVPSDPRNYYRLLRRATPDGPSSVVDMRIGTGSPLTLMDSIPICRRAFFSVERIPLANAQDLDGDGLTDVQELQALPARNPWIASQSVPFADGLIYVDGREAFEAISHFDNFPGAPNVREVKFLILNVDTPSPQLYFLNASKHIYHYYFAREVLNYQPQLSFNAGLTKFNGDTYWNNETRKNLAGSLVVHQDYQPPGQPVPGIITMEFWPSDAVNLHYVQLAYDLVTRSMPWVETRVAYHAASETQRTLYRTERAEFATAQESALHTVLTEDLFGATKYTMLNPGVGYGRLVVFDGTGSLSPRDVVIFHNVPNDITHLAGIITEVPQTPLSHVNLKAKQNNTPNAYIKDAAGNPALAALIGKNVRFETLAEGFSVREATAEEVDTYLEALRPPNPQIPVRDLSATTIRPLAGLGFNSARSYGAKTSNVAELRKIIWSPGVYVPDGFGIPFYFYDEFMKANGLYDVAATMLANERFQKDADFRAYILDVFRKQIRNGTVPAALMDKLTVLQSSFPVGTAIRLRSSTNNEDLTGYSGAGLYDSYTHYPDEGHISKSVKQVWASLWQDRAVDEREFYRVDHLQTAMGILVHPAFEEEQANGVGVTRNLIDPNWTGYYINAQVGENLVTNPEANSVPEEFLIAQLLGQSRYTMQYVTFSNQVPEDQRVLTVAQAELLADQMAKIHSRFRGLYGNPPNFAMELEWKIDADGKLAIKQTRPWID